MKVLVDKCFDHDVAKIKDKKLHNTIADCIERIQKTTKLTEIPNCKKMKGSRNAYRIRIGDYRIGFVFEKQCVVLVRFLHRGKIYDEFPD